MWFDKHLSQGFKSRVSARLLFLQGKAGRGEIRIMRFLIIFLFVGLASAATLHTRDDTKTELGKTLKEGLDRVLKKIKEAVDEGKHVKQELVDKAHELVQKLKDAREEMGSKSREILQDIREKARDYLKKVIDYLDKDKKPTTEQRTEINLRDVLLKIKEHLKKNVDPELLKEKIEKIFGQGSQLLDYLFKVLKEQGKKKMEMLIDAFLDDDDEDDSRESRSLKEYWEKVKNYFKDLKIDLQEKYMKFGEWVKENYKKGMETSKDKMENIKAIAREFARHAKNVSKEIGAEASEFFRQYKDDLGNIWDELKETFNEIRNRQD